VSGRPVLSGGFLGSKFFNETLHAWAHLSSVAAPVLDAIHGNAKFFFFA
jgi:hypothetical protein